MCTIFKIDLSTDIINCLSTRIKNQRNLYNKIVFISANRRVIRFVRKNLSIEEQLHITFLTIEDFAKNLFFSFSEKNIKTHSKLEREIFILNMIKNNFKELYSTLGKKDEIVFIWAKRISVLFDEIDRRLLKDKLENYLYVEGVKPAKAILENLKNLYITYDNEYDSGYNGRFLKFAANIEENNLCKKYKDTLFIFAGTVFFTESEKQLLKKLNSVATLEFFFHVDLHNLDAGKNYKFDSFFSVNKVIKAISDTFTCSTIENKADDLNMPDIEFYEFSNTHDESIFISEKLQDLTKYTKTKEPTRIGVVLPHSKPLFPILSILPSSVEPINVTQGYPFVNTDFGIFITNLLELLRDINILKDNEEYKCKTKQLLNFLNSPIISKLNSVCSNELKSKIINKQGSIYIFDENESLFKNLLNMFLNIQDLKDFSQAFENLIALIDKSKFSAYEDRFTLQMINFFLREVVEPLKDVSFKNTNFLLFCNIMQEIINDLNVPFEGYPLQGIQFLGLLEARLLSFDYLFIVDTNEGLLPSYEKIDPLLPNDIKTALGLENYRDKENLIKYYFFRNVFSSKKKVYVLYQTGSTSIQKATRSRFVDQLILQLELKGKDLNNLVKQTSVEIKIPTLKDGIDKTDSIHNYFGSRLKNCMSPTELDLYMNCPYKYYLKKIKNIKAPLRIDEDYAADIVGRILHKLLEKSFEQYMNQNIDIDKYKKIGSCIQKKIDDLKTFFTSVDHSIQEYIDILPPLKFDFLKIILRHRIKQLFFETSQGFQTFKLLGVEKEFKDDKLKIKGIFDRIDEVDSSIRIIDYKTSLAIKKPKVAKVKTLEIDKLEFDKKSLRQVKDIIVSLQFPSYKILAENPYNKKNIFLEAYLLSQSNALSKKIEIDNIDIYIKIINYIKNHMKESEKIYALPSDNCMFCEYKHFCSFTI